MEEKPPDISQKNLDAILEYLPLFEQPSFAAGLLKQEAGYLPYYQYDSKVHSFIRDLYEHGFIFSFDWPCWQDKAQRFVENPDSLAQADLLTLQKLLTTHVRKDRFCEGHLASVLESGHIAAVLRRLKQICEANKKEKQ